MNDIPFGAWIAFAGLIFTILMASGGIVWALVWKMSDTTAALKDIVTDRLRIAAEENARKIAEHRFSVDGQIEAVRKAMGEVGHASQSKITQLEFYVRDRLEQYVLKEDFRDDLKTITSIVDTLGTRIEKRLESFEGKLDELQKFNMNRPV